MPYSEDNIRDKIIAGDPAGLKALMHAYYHTLFRFTLQHVKMEEAAHKMVQATFDRIWIFGAEINRSLPFHTYIGQLIAHFIYEFLQSVDGDGPTEEELWKQAQKAMDDASNESFDKGYYLGIYGVIAWLRLKKQLVYLFTIP